MDIVLGAGIVGVSVALHLQARGRDVVLVDKSGPAAGTSFGNAGIVECSDMLPRAFPRGLTQTATHLLTSDTRVRFDWAYLPMLAPWLLSYRRASAPRRLARISRELTPLHMNALAEHRALLKQAGGLHLLREGGYMTLYRKHGIPADVRQALLRVQDLGVRADMLSSEEIAAREPALRQRFAGGVHWRSSAAITDPGALVALLAARFESQGGSFVTADALSLKRKGKAWTLAAPGGKIEADNVVVAMGPWSADLIRRLGYYYPLAVKRGYHMHYEMPTDPQPQLTVIDIDNAYALAPMRAGMRLTSGIEFARRDAPPSPHQLWRAERKARKLYDLGKRLDTRPWLGARPCTADMKPVIGPAPRHEGLWFAFGHAHHGLTLGPVTGRLLAEQMLGEAPCIEPGPFLPSRFHLFRWR